MAVQMGIVSLRTGEIDCSNIEKRQCVGGEPEVRYWHQDVWYARIMATTGALRECVGSGEAKEV